MRCALAEARSRTIVAKNGSEIPWADSTDAICDKLVANQMRGRWERMMVDRMGQIRNELAQRADGERILAEFALCGPVPKRRRNSARAASAY